MKHKAMLGWFHAYPDHQSLGLISRPFWGVLWISQTNVAFLVTSSSCARKTYNKYHVCLWLNPYCLGVFLNRYVLWHDYPWHPLYPPFLYKFSVPQILLQSPKPGSLFFTWWNNRRIFAETSEKSQNPPSCRFAARPVHLSVDHPMECRWTASRTKITICHRWTSK